jgi:hypothetical protein
LVQDIRGPYLFRTTFLWNELQMVLREFPGELGLGQIEAWAAAASGTRRLPHRPTRVWTPPPWRRWVTFLSGFPQG